MRTVVAEADGAPQRSAPQVTEVDVDEATAMRSGVIGDSDGDVDVAMPIGPETRPVGTTRRRGWA